MRELEQDVGRICREEFGTLHVVEQVSPEFGPPRSRIPRQDNQEGGTLVGERSPGWRRSHATFGVWNIVDLPHDHSVVVPLAIIITLNVLIPNGAEKVDGTRTREDLGPGGGGMTSNSETKEYDNKYELTLKLFHFQQ